LWRLPWYPFSRLKNLYKFLENRSGVIKACDRAYYPKACIRNPKKGGQQDAAKYSDLHINSITKNNTKSPVLPLLVPCI
jgi:hypothetical protein